MKKSRDAVFFLLRTITKSRPAHILKAGKAVLSMDNSECALCELRDGECGRVLSADGCRELRRRLPELGFVEGARVKRLFSAPSGDPAAYGIYGAVIALRSADAAGISVKKISPPGKW